MINLGFFVSTVASQGWWNLFHFNWGGGEGKSGVEGGGEEGGWGLVKENTRDASLSKGPPSKNFEIYSP